MTINDMRESLRQVPRYRGTKKWIEKVNAVHTNQVIAVYYRMLKDKML